MKTEQCLILNEMLTSVAQAIMAKKNHDYKGGDEDGLANFKASTVLGVSNTAGILLRVQDKLMRIKTFDTRRELKTDSLLDAFVDVINYMVLAVAVLMDEGEITWDDVLALCKDYNVSTHFLMSDLGELVDVTDNSYLTSEGGTGEVKRGDIKVKRKRKGKK